MARPREFDVETALDRAMHVFWAKGYEATSLDDLCHVTALSRSSLYAAFGSKRDLLLKTLDRYAECGTDRIAAVLAERPIGEAVRTLLRRFIAEITAGPGRSGCFIGNCAAEFGARDRLVKARVRSSPARIEATFQAALVAAKARGELTAGADLTALARFLTSSFQGLRLVGKVNPDPAILGDIADVIQRCLDEHRVVMD